MNYQQFLRSQQQELRIPYSGKGKASNNEETFRVKGDLSAGWYQFQVEGRYLNMITAIDPEFEKWNLPTIRGYFAQNRFISSNSIDSLYDLDQDEELERYQPVLAKRWFDSSLWFECADFETEVEDKVRQAFEEEHSLDEIKGITPPLAQAFFLDSTAREVARAAERARLEAVAEQKRQEERRLWLSTLEGRLANTLANAGATLLDWRRYGSSQTLVRYRLGQQRFECVIDTSTFQILDAGICLEGTDDRLNLSSLPSVVREAIETHQLHIMR